MNQEKDFKSRDNFRKNKTINKEKESIRNREYRTIKRDNKDFKQSLEHQKEPMDFFSLQAFFCL